MDLQHQDSADLSPLLVLRQSDYPRVKHWVRKRGDSSQVLVIKVVDAGSTSDNDKNHESGDLSQEDEVLAFFENNDGKLISYDDKQQLYRAMRGFWNDHIDGHNPPLNWFSAGETLRNTFWDFLESKFFYSIFVSALVAGKLKSSGSRTIIAGFSLLSVKRLLQVLGDKSENISKDTQI